MAAGETRHQFAGFNNKCGAVVTFCPVLHCMNKIIWLQSHKTFHSCWRAQDSSSNIWRHWQEIRFADRGLTNYVTAAHRKQTHKEIATTITFAVSRVLKTKQKQEVLGWNAYFCCIIAFIFKALH